MTAPAAAGSPPAPAKTTPETKYVVLERIDQAGVISYCHQKTLPARSSEQAIRAFAEKTDKPGGTYVAIPERSWRHLTVKAETTTTLKLEEAH